MRRTWIAAVPVLASLLVVPAQGQVLGRVHIVLPIGRPGPVVYNAPRRQLIVREYDEVRFGAWDRYYDEWIPETVYYYDGYYYDYPVVAYAEPVRAYRYRDEMFFAPRQREFVVWHERYRERDYRWKNGRKNRSIPRNDRDDRQYRPPRDDRDQRQVPPATASRDAYRSRPRPR